MKLTKEYLLTLENNQRIKEQEIFKEFYNCKVNPRYCIETYFSVVAGANRVPFKLFPHQIKTLDSYEKYQNVITMKTRQMGFTTFTGAWIAWNMMTKNNFHVLIISKRLDDTKKFIAEIKAIIDEVVKEYPWLCRGYVDGHNNKTYFKLEKTNSTLTGQSTTDDAGRGFSAINALVIDEVAFIDRKSPEKMNEIVAAAGIALTTVRGKMIAISTPKGQSGWYYDTYNNADKKGFRIVNAHWTEHPIYKKGTYKWIKDDNKPAGGYIKFLDPNWPEQVFDQATGMYIELKKEDYQFVLDGKIRSPWYDFESRRLGPERTRCELDCSFMGTGGEVLDADTLRELQLFLEKSKYNEFTNPFGHINGIFREYKEYIAPIEGKRYVLSADVATGDGSDYSAITVIDVETLDVCGTFKAQLIPDTFGKLIFLVGKRFGNCPVIVENAGGGGTTLQTLKQDGYPNIYYSILKKNDPSTGMKKRKIGLWPSEEVRWQGGDRLEQLIRLSQLKIHCKDILTELNTWIWDKDGKRRHAPEKNDDLIMALQHGVYYIYYVIKRADKNRELQALVSSVKRNGVSINKIESTNQYSGLGGMISNTAESNSTNKFLYKYRDNYSNFNIDNESGMNLQRRGMIL